MMLEGKVALVTGARGGIGRAIVNRFVKEGAIVYAADLSPEGSLDAQGDENGHFVKLDVTREDDVIAAMERIHAEHGKLDILVNAAGIEIEKTIEDTSLEEWNRSFAVNVTGSFLCAREAVKAMSTRHGGNGGVIVNVSSAASRLGSANEYVDYAASKGAIDTMTMGLANEVASEGIRVNAVRPGFIKTEIHAQGGEPGRLERVRPNIPLGRAGEAEEVAQAILWLLSDESSYCTGGFIDCAGGR